MKGLFIPEITAEMFRNGCLESIEQLMAEGEIYDIEYPLEQEPCEDCISRAEAVRIASGYSHWTNIADELKKMPSVQPKTEQKTPQVARWIPVSKELPERDVNVLAYCKNNSFEYQKVMWIDDYTGRWYGYLSHFDKVLAWMPLPKPYKESEEGK